jgi:hypothetical protein
VQYRPYKKVAGTDADFIALAPVNSAELTLEALPAKATVSIQVVALNPAGESPRTPEVQVTLA